MADYITTHSGVHMTPLQPKEEQLRIEDIAHALSFMTRANGHFPEFYSVAQHCLACSAEAEKRGYGSRIALACLLHDGAEAYLSDITRPIKKNLPYYTEVEQSLLSLIYQKFLGTDLSMEEEALVKRVDDTMLFFEFRHYMNEELPYGDGTLKSEPIFSFRPFAEVEQEYLQTFKRLKAEIA